MVRGARRSAVGSRPAPGLQRLAPGSAAHGREIREGLAPRPHHAATHGGRRQYSGQMSRARRWRVHGGRRPVAFVAGQRRARAPGPRKRRRPEEPRERPTSKGPSKRKLCARPHRASRRGPPSRLGGGRGGGGGQGGGGVEGRAAGGGGPAGQRRVRGHERRDHARARGAGGAGNPRGLVEPPSRTRGGVRAAGVRAALEAAEAAAGGYGLPVPGRVPARSGAARAFGRDELQARGLVRGRRQGWPRAARLTPHAAFERGAVGGRRPRARTPLRRRAPGQRGP
mmetsp:Transcript_46371/g.104732  ORF Transcript_46371/g.104732 Transcript_46371/m.104732 type:complete len:283 (+) Transcript_46371:385-1233(+)